MPHWTPEAMIVVGLLLIGGVVSFGLVLALISLAFWAWVVRTVIDRFK